MKFSRQTTLRSQATVTGVGVHSGLPVSLILGPAPVDAGFIFVRTGLDGADREVVATADAVIATEFATVLGDREGPLVSTAEHVLGGRNQRPFAVTQHRRELGCDHRIGGGHNFAVGTVETGTDENKARINGCRSQDETDRKTGMNAYASHGGLRPKRCLTAKLHSIMPTTRLHSIQVAKLPQGRLA